MHHISSALLIAEILPVILPLTGLNYAETAAINIELLQFLYVIMTIVPFRLKSFWRSFIA